MPLGSKLRLALVQFTPNCDDVSASLATASALIGSKKADIFILPHLPSVWGAEQAARHAEGPDGPTCTFLREMALAKKAYVIGSYVAEPSLAPADRPTFRTSVFAPDGAPIAHYDSIHLCSTLGEPAHLSAGQAMPFFDLLTFRSGVIGSYDLRFPELAREFALSSGFLLIVSGAYRRSERGAWDSLLAARAAEDQMFVIGCNLAADALASPAPRPPSVGDGLGGTPTPSPSENPYGGGSAVFAPDGRKIHQAGERDQVLILDIDPFEVEWARTRSQFLTDARPASGRAQVLESPLDKG